MLNLCGFTDGIRVTGMISAYVRVIFRPTSMISTEVRVIFRPTSTISTYVRVIFRHYFFGYTWITLSVMTRGIRKKLFRCLENVSVGVCLCHGCPIQGTHLRNHFRPATMIKTGTIFSLFSFLWIYFLVTHFNFNLYVLVDFWPKTEIKWVHWQRGIFSGVIPNFLRPWSWIFLVLGDFSCKSSNPR